MTEEIIALSVSDFIELVNDVFSRRVFPAGVAVEGEVAEYRVSQGKWIWFRLKDGDAIVDCFATVWQLRSPLEDGMRVRAFARPKIHPKSGKFSLNVERVEPLGEGALRRAFELLRAKLEREGVFAAERKRTLPEFPERIGLIASRESAAYSDFLRILGGRWGGLTVNSLHVQVQGKDAVGDIVRAFRHFNEHPELADVIVLTRGGGSLEDLQAFNSEEVVRAVATSRVPVICAVGHERDESLADLAADVRASTPTHAAEVLVPDRAELAAAVATGRRRLWSWVRGAVASERERVARQLERLESRVSGEIERGLRRIQEFGRSARLFDNRLRGLGRELSGLGDRLDRLMANRLRLAGERLVQSEKLLQAVSPRRPLSLGYALITGAGGIVRSVKKLNRGDAVSVEFIDGRAVAEIKEINLETYAKEE
jgi:exodeoxyribonuclease VII large subunit